MNAYYSDVLDPHRFYQGDVLRDYDIIILPDKIARPSLPDTANSHSGTAQILVKILRTNIMIISQTCDISNRDFLAVCPIFPMTRLNSSNKMDVIRKHKVNYRFWLPEKSGYIEESYADFQIINTVKIENIDIDSRIVSLTERYRTHLTNGLNKYFCRPITIEG